MESYVVIDRIHWKSDDFCKGDRVLFDIDFSNLYNTHDSCVTIGTGDNHKTLPFFRVGHGSYRTLLDIWKYHLIPEQRKWNHE